MLFPFQAFADRHSRLQPLVPRRISGESGLESSAMQHECKANFSKCRRKNRHQTDFNRAFERRNPGTPAHVAFTCAGAPEARHNRSPGRLAWEPIRLQCRAPEVATQWDNTYTKAHFPIVFSTKSRQKLIANSVQPTLCAYMAGIYSNWGRNVESPSAELKATSILLWSCLPQ
jgi:hypothetical protein